MRHGRKYMVATLMSIRKTRTFPFGSVFEQREKGRETVVDERVSLSPAARRVCGPSVGRARLGMTLEPLLQQ